MLGPLWKFLRGNVGRPWDKVYSELSEHLDKRKTTGLHVFDHIEQEVKQHCFTGQDGGIYSYRGYGAPIPVYGLYVHPRTRLLCWGDAKSPWEERRAANCLERQRQSEWRVLIKGNRHYVKLSGICIQLYNRSQVPPELEAQMTLVTEGQSTWRVTNKRRCGHKELKTAHLTNLNA